VQNFCFGYLLERTSHDFRSHERTNSATDCTETVRIDFINGRDGGGERERGIGMIFPSADTSGMIYRRRVNNDKRYFRRYLRPPRSRSALETPLEIVTSFKGRRGFLAEGSDMKAALAH